MAYYSKKGRLQMELFTEAAVVITVYPGLKCHPGASV